MFRKSSVMSIDLRSNSALSGERTSLGPFGRLLSPPSFARPIWYVLIASLFFTDRRLFPNVLRDAGQISSILVLLVWAIVLSWGCIVHNLSMPRGRLYTPFYWFLVISAVSILLSARAPIAEYRGEVIWVKGVKQLLHLLLSSSVFILTPLFIRSWKDLVTSIKWLVYTIVWLSAFVAVIEIVHYYWPSGVSAAIGGLFHDKFAVYPVVTPVGRFPRINALAWEPSMTANYLLILWPLPAMGIMDAENRHSPVFARISFVVCLLLLLLTFSGGGYLAFIAQLCVFLLLARRGSGYSVTLAGVILGIVIIWLSPVGDALLQVLKRLLSISPSLSTDLSARWRMIEHATAFNTFRRSPLVGVGLGNSLFYILRDFPEWGLGFPGAAGLILGTYGNPISVNNLWLRILAEVGIIGFIPFVLWHFRILRDALVKIPQVWESDRRGLLTSLIVVFCGQMVHYFSLSGFQFKYWFLMAGLLTVATRMIHSEPAERIEFAKEAQCV